MKPRRLKFAGIGSFPGEVDINFDDLNQMGLYLIVGRTGAGKTTILDAMTFALYGKVAAGPERAIVSAHPSRKAPMIEFEFSHADRSYVVHREPTPQGSKARPAKPWMSERDTTGKEIGRFTGKTQVNDKVETIVGLSAEEFMQVILLPQGKFQQFLLAGGKDKQTMLQTIFGTWAYRRMVDKLEAEARRLDEEVAAERSELGNQWAIIHSAHNELGGQGLAEGLSAPDDDLDSLVSGLAVRSGELDEEESAARTSHNEATAKLKSAKSDEKRFDDAATKASLEKEQKSAAKSAETARERVSSHNRAEPVAAAVHRRDTVSGELRALETAVSQSRDKILRASGKLKVNEEVTKRFVDAIPTATPAALRAEFERMREAIDTAQEDSETLAEIEENLEDKLAQLEDAEKEFGALSKKHTAAGAAHLRAKQLLDDALDALKGLRDAEKKVRDLDDLLEKADVDAAVDELSAAREEYASANTAWDGADAALRKAHETRNKELAGELASNLKTGDPCPVCGSTDHPRKAKSSRAGSIDIETAESARDAALGRKKSAERDLKTAQKAVETAKEFRGQLPAPDAQSTLRKNFDKLQEVNDGIDELRAQADEASDDESEISEALSEAKQVVAELKADIKALKKDQAKLSRSVSAVGTIRAIELSVDECDTIDQLIEELETAVSNTTEAAGRLKERGAEVTRTLKTSRFPNEKAALALVLDDSTLAALTEAVDTFDNRAARIERLAISIGADPVPKNRPDVDELEAVAGDMEAAAKEASSRAGTARSALKQIKKAHKEIGRIGPRIEQMTSKAAEAATIAKVFKDGAGGPDGQLGLEMWVQRTLFEEVCLVANGQLRSLSSNRYALTLEQEEGGVRKRHGNGLDIYVLDAQTGLTRPVNTMSGGEQFMASLALALALAEVVQRHAGGIELPCLFIDEGFGGLDLESLDLAIDMLLKLQSAGRTVGIITHVETMQQQLPIGIRVHRSETGSTLEVLAG